MGLNLIHLGQAIWNAARMNRDERARRVMSAFVSRDIYYYGRQLQKLASQVKDEFFLLEVNDYLNKFEILGFDKVWELEEANEISAELRQRISEVQKRIEEESNG